jgi:RNA 3'-terminal phosphate cyclase (ATP)
MADRAGALLAAAGLAADIALSTGAAVSTGAALFLGAAYGHGRGGVTALGKRGEPAETVAEEAAAGLLAYHRSGAAVDAFLADQLIVPAALADGPSLFAAERMTRHLTTNAWVVQQFGLARVELTALEGGLGLVKVTPLGAGR